MLKFTIIWKRNFSVISLFPLRKNALQMVSTSCKRSLGKVTGFELNCNENVIPVKLLKALFLSSVLLRRLHRYAKNRSQTHTQSFMITPSKCCLLCSEGMHDKSNEVIIGSEFRMAVKIVKNMPFLSFFFHIFYPQFQHK